MDEKGFVEGVRRYMSQLREEKRYSSAKRDRKSVV